VILPWFLDFPGLPASTLLHAVRLITELSNPHNISLRGERLEIMDSAYGLRSDVVRIQYASKYAGQAMHGRRWKGENLGLARIDAVGKKKAIEAGVFKLGIMNCLKEIHTGTLCLLLTACIMSLKNIPCRGIMGVRHYMLLKLSGLRMNFQDCWRSIHLMEQDFRSDRCEVITEDFSKLPSAIDRDVFVAILEMYRDNIDPEFYPAFFSDR
jgi:hypothetical protein